MISKDPWKQWRDQARHTSDSACVPTSPWEVALLIWVVTPESPSAYRISTVNPQSHVPRLQSALSPKMSKEFSWLTGVHWVGLISHLPANSKPQALPSTTQDKLLLLNGHHIPIEAWRGSSRWDTQEIYTAKRLVSEETGLSQRPAKWRNDNTPLGATSASGAPDLMWPSTSGHDSSDSLMWPVSKSQPATWGMCSEKSCTPCFRHKSIIFCWWPSVGWKPSYQSLFFIHRVASVRVPSVYA